MNAARVGDWQPPVLRTVATKGEGVAGLANKIHAHRTHLLQGERLARFEENRSALRFEELLRDALFRQVHLHLGPEKISRMVRAIARREQDPYTAVEEILRQMKQEKKS